VSRLVLWRHGQTESNLLGRFQGQADVELSEVGREQAALAAVRLARLAPDAIISSDLRRAVATAEALSSIVQLAVQTDPRLRERHFGQWQGRSIAQVAQQWPKQYARWRAGDPSPGCGIEHLEETSKRAGAALRDVADRYPGGTVVIATHGGAAREGTAALLGWPPEIARTLGRLANCHWIELGLNAVRGWQLLAYNAGP
jgi:broad specificity phosphatase PhoE